MPVRTLSWEDVCRRRLARHRLDRPAPPVDLVEVVRAVGGIHAQILTAAELSISARVSGIAQSHVRTELWERRSVVKTYGPRGTLHLLPADELPMWMAAMRATLVVREDGFPPPSWSAVSRSTGVRPKPCSKAWAKRSTGSAP